MKAAVKLDLLAGDEELAPLIGRLRSDLADAARGLEAREVRYLVDLYYQIQDFRKRSASQTRAAGPDEPNRLVAFVGATMSALEQRIRLAMQAYSEANPLGAWALSLYGVGPVLTAGFLAHIDVERATTAGAVWRFAGLDPTNKWEKGQKRPYNAQLKTLCWRWADVQWKFHNREASYYGPLIAERKAKEERQNEAGMYAEVAANELRTRTFRDKATRASYEAGRLPAGRIHLRALRWGAKLFLSHFWEVGRLQRGLPVVRPYAVEWMGHAHVLTPPNYEPSTRL